MKKNKLKIFTAILVAVILTTVGVLMPLSQAKAQDRGFTSYMNDALKFSIVLAALLAVIMIVIGGFQYILAAGNASTIENAKNRIWQAILGLLLVIGSYLILHTINPDLVNMDLGITPVEIRPIIEPPPCEPPAGGCQQFYYWRQDLCSCAEIW